MESSQIQAGSFTLKTYNLNTLVIGSGAASLNAAISLHALGQKDIVIATSRWGAGTSNNAGSDKQTYYKLSLCGSDPDSVTGMASDLFNGRCMHGDIALCEAQGSVQSFMKLVNLGVPFPHDKYGSWAGYRTDHDPKGRATSAGPYTSKMMFRVLAGEVRRRRIKVLDKHQVVELLTDRDKTRVTGAVAINKSEKDPAKAFVLFNAVNIVLGTGGPGDLYSESVYPASQTGSTGMAFRAGAPGQNLTESQFGIASVRFRWNLSGSYQQVIPRYYSTDCEGNNASEFLNDYFPDYTKLTKAIFLKGYQWPFDVEKISGYGSSLIDLLVYREKVEKGKRVFIDFRQNVSWNGNSRFDIDKLDDEVKIYLTNSGSMQKTPVERLRSMNLPAFNLYSEHGIDLMSEPLEIGICVQHNNGGLKGNIWWESDLKHLFPVGEVNGSHGVKRPGGAALNSGQVGSSRAAEFITRRYNNQAPDFSIFFENSEKQISEILELSGTWLSRENDTSNKAIIRDIRKRMSGAASIIRSAAKVARAIEETNELLENIREKIGAHSVTELCECFGILDNCITQLLYLDAIRVYIEKGGRSRGSYIITGDMTYGLPALDKEDPGIPLCRYDRNVESGILEVRLTGTGIEEIISGVREIPSQDLWFEKVWKDYLEDNYIGG